MNYLLNEWAIYLLGAAAAGAILGALVGWWRRNCTCKNHITEMRTNLEGKINAQASELDEAKKQVVNYKHSTTTCRQSMIVNQVIYS